jgi:hypothetical protein
VTFFEIAKIMPKEDCVLEFRAFARGGKYAIDVLNRVWPNILLEYQVDKKDLPDILADADLCMNRSGRIREYHVMGCPQQSA